MPRVFVRSLALVVLGWTTPGCAARVGGATPAVARDRSVMDEAELLDHSYSSVLAAVVAARPEWLSGQRSAPAPTRGGTSAATLGVFVDDGKQPMSIDYLRTLPVDQAVRVRYLTGSEALATYGPQWIAGALVVTLRR